MKQKKWVAVCLLALFFSAWIGTTVLAKDNTGKPQNTTQAQANTYFAVQNVQVSSVMDTAGILSEGAVASLVEDANRMSQENEIALYLLTVEDYKGMPGASLVHEAAMQFYNDKNLGYGEGRDGVLLMLSMAERDYAYVVYGERANEIFTEEVQIDIESEFLAEFAEDDWFGGFNTFLIESNHEIRFGWVDTLVAWVCIVAVSFLLAFALAHSFRMKLKSVKRNHTATAYVPSDGVQLQVKEDVFTHTTETRTRVKSSGSGGGGGGGGRSFSGGGFSGRSGKF